MVKKEVPLYLMCRPMEMNMKENVLENMGLRLCNAKEPWETLGRLEYLKERASIVFASFYYIWRRKVYDIEFDVVNGDGIKCNKYLF